MDSINNFKKHSAMFMIYLLFLGFPVQAASPKNIIIMIGDGMGFEQVKAAGYYANGQAGSLSFETLPYQSYCTTYSANSGIGYTNYTDSAAAGTAIATGHKVNNGVISKAIPGDYSELQTLLEYFKARGKSTGLVTTCYLSHATPAAFGAHENDRNYYSAIANDLLTQTKPNVLLGGGKYVTSSAAAGVGYTVVTSRDGMLGLNPDTESYVCGRFGADYMPYEYDGTGLGTTYPHLREMTETALDILDKDSDGFFLMVEGGQIDRAGHDNNINRNIHETIEFSNSVQVAMDWAAGRTDTLLIVTADHETGGLTVTETNPQQGVYPSVTWYWGNHTGQNVPVYAWGVNSELVTGGIDNTDIFEIATTNLTEDIHLYVSPSGNNTNGTSWANAYNYLQDALDAASEADSGEIWVAEGTYYPDDGDSVTENNRNETFQLINNVNIYGGFDHGDAWGDRNVAANETILSGDIGTTNVHTDNSYHVVTGANNVTIDGFTIKNGYANGGTYGETYVSYGGGLRNIGVNPTVVNCTFTNNYAAYGGGGIFNLQANSVMITDCTFSNNAAYYYGGGIMNRDSDSTVIRCNFSNNEAQHQCGGAFCDYLSSESMISHCMFTNNTAAYYGGALEVGFQAGPTVVNSVFVDNTATSYGGGAINASQSSALKLLNCTISENSAGNWGGAIFMNQISSMDIKNCIIWGNTPGRSGTDAIYWLSGNQPVVSYSDVQGGYSGIGNVNINPQFEADDYHLSQPGAAYVTDGGITASYGDTDIDDENRVMRGVVDMGADELGWPCNGLQQHGDADGDGYVEFSTSSGPSDDYDKWWTSYTTATYNACCDFDRDGDVDLNDRNIGLLYDCNTGSPCPNCQGAW